MAKQIVGKIKLQAPGGKATPAPPVGPALGQHGVNIGQFVSQFNERTKAMDGMTCSVEITVYKVGDKHLAARSNEFGYANYELTHPVAEVSPLSAAPGSKAPKR